MFRARISWLAGLAALLALAVATPEAQRGGGGAPAPPPTPLSTVVAKPDARVQKLKEAASADVASMYDLGQQMIDMVFSFGELGFQEFETTKYLTGILKQNGFAVETGVAGIPTAWVAKWGSGKPVIALGSDVDCIPQASQKPGVAYHDPIIEGAPGHGEGHNSGTPLNILAAVAVKRVMEREKLPGTIMIWPGIAEELLGTKAYYVRAGLFKDVDAVLYNHVGSNLSTSWGDGGGNGLISVEYRFEGESAHSAGAPWRGRSALDAVELMNVGWNYRREHLRLQQRSHYVVTNGGDQPNVVPSNASVWYYFRETNYDAIKNLWDIGDKMAEGASLMTNTKWSSKVLGSAWPSHMNRTLAETMQANIAAVGLPTWTDADVQLAKATQKELGVPEIGLATKVNELRGREFQPDEDKRGGGSDDIGDISWNVPTVSLSFPANFQAGPGHNWANGIAMATPIAHKGTIAGARVQAMMLLDALTRPDVIAQAREYFEKVQTKNQKYTPLIRSQDQPATYLNKATMEKYRPEMRKYYYDPAKYKTYLEQLGIKYPTVRAAPTSAAK
ncbi:MAG TPA: amidohydrolase [Vicinamibacterales bacterium]|nr:amidohydrolase [Vicinamibacterales bacterium]